MDYSRLLNYLWRAGRLVGCEFTGAAGEKIAVESEGEPSDIPDVWYAARIVVDGERRHGTVAVGAETSVPDGAILRVVEGDVPPVIGIDDRLVPQVEYEIEPSARQCYDALRAGASRRECAKTIACMEPPYRTSLLTSLLVERLGRKFGDIMKIFEASGEDWNQTFYVMLLRVMGGNQNREAYMSLAGRVNYSMLSREKSSVKKIEALLLGGGGFLFVGSDSLGSSGYGSSYPGSSGSAAKDDYTLMLEDEFRHLAAKYSIVPLKPAVWDISKLRSANFPTVRLAEIAALIAKKDFMLDVMLACRNAVDVDELFGVQASEYWNTHSKPGVEHGISPKRIGRSKTALVGINLVAPLMFTYGKQTGSDELCDRALDVLASLPAEENSKLVGWYSRGCVAESGFDSQALLQLTDEYCTAGLCADCRVGREELKRTYKRNHL